jgi:hypothetical protein
LASFVPWVSGSYPTINARLQSRRIPKQAGVKINLFSGPSGSQVGDIFEQQSGD